MPRRLGHTPFDSYNMDVKATKHLHSTAPMAACFSLGQVRIHAIFYLSHANKFFVDGLNEKRGLLVYDNSLSLADSLPTLDYLDLPTMSDLSCLLGNSPLINTRCTLLISTKELHTDSAICKHYHTPLW